MLARTQKIALAKKAALVLGAAMMALAPAAADARPGSGNLGAARGGAKSSVSRGSFGGGGGGMNRNPGGNVSRSMNASRSGNVNRNGNQIRGGNNNVNVGNTVVVGGGNRGNFNNGYHNNNGHWDNNDNDFMEFVGKAAVVTAGVAVVAAVIGSTTTQQPANCQQSVSNGQVYLNCNGTWYQPMTSNGQQQYTVIAPPR